MVDENDPGGKAFYGGITATFERMRVEELPTSKTSNRQDIVDSMKNLLDRHGTMAVLVGMARAMDDKSKKCCHHEWLSLNFNVLVNHASKYNTEQYGFPFGL